MNTLTATTHSHEEYCESLSNKKNTSSFTLTDIAVIGCYALFVIALGALSWYGAVSGFYPILPPS